MAASTLNAIFRDVYILSQHIIDPIEYVRLTNGSDIILQFRDIDIPEGSTADVVVIRPDGTGIQNEADVIVEPGNVVGIEVTDTMFSVLGTSYLQVRITHGDSVIVNFAIPVHVRENYTEGDYPPSENEGGFFDDAKEAVEDANQAADSANKAAADANAAADAANQAAEDANTAIEDLPNEYYMLTSGTEIPGNADMDTYKTPGNYYIKSAPTSSPNNVQNAPFTRAFTLKVEYANGSDAYIMQTYRVWNTGEKAVRVFSDNAWGAYEYFSSDDALVTEKEFDELYTSEKTIVGAINSLMQPITSLTSRDNLNNITTPGRYTGGGSYVPNSPFSGSYELEVIRTTDGIAQSFFCTDTGERAFRLQKDGAWSEYAYFRADATVYEGVEIQQGTDLNTLTTPGVYYSPASTVTATLINMPEMFVAGFAFHVYYVGFTVVQLMLPTGVGGCIFTRSKTVAAWQKWHKYTNDSDLEGILKEIFPDWANTVSVPALRTSNKTLAGAINDTMSNSYSLTGGTAIPENADMDDYKARGNFYCDQNRAAATLQNAPFTNAFTLKVIYGTGSSYPMQIYREYIGGNVAVRYITDNSQTWSGYYYYSDDNRLANVKSFSALKTTAKTIVGAINEVNAKAGSGGGGVEIVTLEKAADSEGFTINAFEGYAAKQGRIVTAKINARITTNSDPFNEKLCSVPEGFLPYSGATGSALVGKAFMSIGGVVGMADLRVRDGFLCMTYKTDNLSALNSASLDINFTYLAAE